MRFEDQEHLQEDRNYHQHYDGSLITSEILLKMGAMPSLKL